MPEDRDSQEGSPAERTGCAGERPGYGAAATRDTMMRNKSECQAQSDLTVQRANLKASRACRCNVSKTTCVLTKRKFVLISCADRRRS